jgi:hypothetical protein
LNKINRIFFGGLIGWLAGFSFGTSLLPFLLTIFLPDAPVAVYDAMRQWALPATVLWIPAGAFAAYRGGAVRGGQIFAAGALVAGLLYGLLIAAGSSAWPVVVVSAGAAALYGWGAGLLVGGGFGPA